MALSGSFNTTAYGNRYLTFSWTGTPSIAGNYTTISWELKGAGSASGYYMAGPFYVSMGGRMLYESTSRIQLWNGTTVASGSETFSHNADGSLWLNAAVEAGIYYNSVNVSGSGAWTINPIPRAATLLTATDFTDESDPSITYSNPAGNAVSSMSAYIYADDDSTILIDGKSLDINGTSFTFSLTDTERENLRTVTTTNSRTVKFYIATVINGTTYWSNAINKTFSIINATPTINPVVVDGGSTSTQLTGNPNTMIRYFNSMEASINAQAYKHATITAMKIINGGITLFGDGAFYNTGSNVFEFRAQDSRGNPVEKVITVPMVDYVPLTCTVDADIALDTEDNTKAVISFTVSGNYFNGSFGAVNNTLDLSYTLEYEGGGISLSPLTLPETAFNGTTYSYTYTIPEKLDYQKAYTVKVIASDKIYSDINSSSKTLKAIPVFDWGEQDFSFNVPISVQNSPVADFVVEEGEKDGWLYRNWKSGKGECWKIVHIQSAINVPWGSTGLYYGSVQMERQTYPFPFKTKPVENANLQTGRISGWLYPWYGGDGVSGSYQSAIYDVLCPVPEPESDIYISIYAYGELLNS